MSKSKISPSGSGKKLVQARLPFKTLSSSSEKADKKLELNVIGDDKKIKSNEIKIGKRKSLDEIVKPVAKIPRKDQKSAADKNVVLSDEKENSKNSKCVEIVISDDESILDGESNASSVNENRDEIIETKSSEASLTSEADAVDAPSSKKSLKFGKKKGAQAESKEKNVKSKGKNKQTRKTPTEEGVVVLDESDKEEEGNSGNETKTKEDTASDNVCKPNEKTKNTEKDEAKVGDTIDVPDSVEDQTKIAKEEAAKPLEIPKNELKMPEPVKKTKKPATVRKTKEAEKVVDEFDATLGLIVSDSETEMGDESKAEMKKQKSRSPQAPPDQVMKELRVVLTPISVKRKRSSTQTASPKRETPSRKAKQKKMEPPALAVLEVSDNAMDISLSEKENAVDLDVSVTESSTVSNTEPQTPKLRSTNKPASDVRSSEKKTPMSKLQKQKEREEKEQQRLKEKEEREEKRKKEKEEKEEQKRKEREEKEEQRRKEKEEKDEQRRKEKEEKEEQRKKEKDEKEKKRLAELEAKNEEKRQKEEERKKREEQKEEERRKKEEERRKKEQEKEEAENKKKKAAEVFTKFFSLGKKTTVGATSEANESQKLVFMPFRIKNGMKLAPVQRRELKPNDKDALENILKKSEASKVLYIEELKKNVITPRRTSATLTENYEKIIDSDVEIVDDDLKEVGESIEESKPIHKFRAKFLWFHENRRPPYYGTFRKKSDNVKPRRPFARDKKFFDYEIDSDDEWEEEEIGESLHGSDDEKEKESEDEYEVDNEFFVPHGHLSDEELQREDELDEIDDDDDATREAQKEKMKLLEEEFNQSIKKRTEKIQPRLVGIVWQDENGNRPASCCDKVWTTLMARAMVTHGLIVLESPENSNTIVESSFPISAKKIPKKTEFEPEDIKNLAILIHGNRHKKQFLIREFQAFVNKDQTDPALSKFANITIKNQLDKIAKWSVYSNEESKKKKLSWIVSDEVLKQYGLENIGLKNTWKYVTEPKYENEIDEAQIKDDEPKSRPSTPSVITKFTKILTKEEKDQKFCKSPSVSEQKNAFKLLKGETSNLASKKGMEADSGKSIKRTSASVKKIAGDKDSTKMKKRKLFQKKEQNPESIETIELNDSNSDTDDEVVKINKKESPEVKKVDPPMKKRAVLLSVPLGKEIPENVKNEFISKTLKQKKDTEPIAVDEKVCTRKEPTELPQKKKRVPLLSVPFGKVITEDAKKEFVSKVLTQNKSKTVKNSEDNKETLVVSKNPQKDGVSDVSKVESEKVSKRPLSPTRDQPPAKKRVPLLSVPLGKTIPDNVRNEFVTKSLMKKKDNETTTGPAKLSDEGETKPKTQCPDKKSEGLTEVELPISVENALIESRTEKTEEESNGQEEKPTSLTESTKSEKPVVAKEAHKSMSSKEQTVETCPLSVEESSEKYKTGSSEKETINDTESAEQVTTEMSCTDTEKSQGESRTERAEEKLSSIVKAKNEDEVKPEEPHKTVLFEDKAAEIGPLFAEETSAKSKTALPEKETSNNSASTERETTKKSSQDDEKVSTVSTEESSQVAEIETEISKDTAAPDERTSSKTAQGKEKEIIKENVTVLPETEVPLETIKESSTTENSTE